MSMDDKKHRYLNATLPEAVKEAKERSSLKSDERMKKLEDSIAALTDMMTKSNRDNLDAMYNLDADNFSPAFKKQIKAWANESGEGFEILSQRITDAVEALADYKQEVTDTYATTSMLSQYITSNAAEGLVNQAKSEIQTYADDTFATTSMLSEYVTSGEVASTVESAVRTYADGRYASVESLASITDSNGNVSMSKIVQSVTESEAFADLETTAANAAATVWNLVQRNYATLGMIASVTDDDGNVNAASIVAAVNDAGSSVKIDADKILLKGDTSFISGIDDDEEESIRITGNDIKMNLFRGDSSSNACIAFYYDGIEEGYPMGSLRTKNKGSGSESEARYAIQLESLSFSNYDVALKLKSAGDMSLESDYTVYLDAYEEVRLSADASMIHSGLNFGSWISHYYDNDYDSLPINSWIFCKDGIYYHSSGNGLWRMSYNDMPERYNGLDWVSN